MEKHKIVEKSFFGKYLYNTYHKMIRNCKYKVLQSFLYFIKQWTVLIILNLQATKWITFNFLSMMYRLFQFPIAKLTRTEMSLPFHNKTSFPYSNRTSVTKVGDFYHVETVYYHLKSVSRPHICQVSGCWLVRYQIPLAYVKHM